MVQVHALGLTKEVSSFHRIAHPHQGDCFLFKGVAGSCLHLFFMHPSDHSQSTTGCPPQHTRPRESWGLTLLRGASRARVVRTMGAVT